MAEANPTEGTSNLSIHQAVDTLLAVNDPPAEDNQNSEEPVAEEAVEATEAETDADEAVETDELEAASEDIDYDEIEDEEDGEAVEIEAAQPETYKIKVGDEEVDVTLDDLRNGYMRQSDYTRKTQELAENRKGFDTELNNLAAQRNDYADKLAFLETALAVPDQPAEYWQELRSADPDRYQAERAQLLERKEALEEVAKQRAQVQQEQTTELQRQAAQRLQAEQARLPEMIPEWTDPSIAEREKKDLIPYLEKTGYTTQELGAVSDARALVLARKAMLYDKLMEGKPVAQKKSRKAPKMAKAGQPKTKKQVSQRRRQQAFNNIGKQKGRKAMDAAVDYLLNK